MKNIGIGIVIGISIFAGLASFLGYWEYQQGSGLEQEKSEHWTKIWYLEQENSTLHSEVEGWKTAHKEKELLIEGLIEEKNILYSDNSKLQNELDNVKNDYRIMQTQHDTVATALGAAQTEQQQSQLEGEQLAKEQKQKELEQKQKELEQKQKELEQWGKEVQQQTQLGGPEKATIIEMAKTNPRIKGIINGELRFYIEPLPSYASSDVKNAVEEVADVFETFTISNAEVNRVYNENSADIYISWIKNYGSHTLGQAIFNSHIKVGLGTDNCFGDWRPFDSTSVMKVLWHEIGHSIGYGHSDDSNNIMYYQTSHRFAIDQEFSDIISDGWWITIPFCGSGSYYYTLSTDNENDGFDIYVLPSETDPQTFLSESGLKYVDCGRKHMQIFSHTCNVETGSKILIYNYKSNPIKISGQIIDRDIPQWPDTSFDEKFFIYDSDWLNEIWYLFH